MPGDGDAVLRLDSHYAPYGHAALLALRRARPGAALKYRWCSGAPAVPVPAVRDPAVPKSLERLRAAGEIVSVFPRGGPWGPADRCADRGKDTGCVSWDFR
ncbi:hypothetical protein SSCG_05356 [Streptomyces clavuligerus]|nr:hypothetical protein SSCG_05356 [Streptomyces clavuligerus]